MKVGAISGFAVMAMLLSGCVAPPVIPDAVLGDGALQTPRPDDSAMIASADLELDPNQAYVCEQEPRSGSHIPRTVCRTIRRAREDREVQERPASAAVVDDSAQ
jgi:hypothetical protein